MHIVSPPQLSNWCPFPPSLPPASPSQVLTMVPAMVGQKTQRSLVTCKEHWSWKLAGQEPSILEEKSGKAELGGVNPSQSGRSSLRTPLQISELHPQGYLWLESTRSHKGSLYQFLYKTGWGRMLGCAKQILPGSGRWRRKRQRCAGVSTDLWCFHT